MALTNAQVREILSTAGIPAENVEDAVKKIMDGHVTSINALREERDNYKADAEKLPDVQKELNNLKAKGDPDWQRKYEDEHNSFEEFKTQVADEKAYNEKVELYRGILKECNIGERQIANIIRVSGDAIKSISVKDGKIEDSDKLKENIKSEWSGFVMTEKRKGAEIDNPPDGQAKEKHEESRAAKIAAEYHESLYGKAKGE